MKKQFFAVLFAVLSVQGGQAQIKETDLFLKEVFAALKAKDEARFVKLYPDKDRFKKLLLNMMKAYSGDGTASINKGLARFGDITDSSLYKEFSKEFVKAMEKGISANVDWSEAVMTSYEVDTVDANELNGRQLRGKIYFTSNRKDYFLSFDEVLWPEGDPGWFGIAIKTISEKALENDVDLFERHDTTSIVIDSSFITSDSIQQQKLKSKNPPAKKTANKPAAAKPKLKTKSSGKKPD